MRLKFTFSLICLWKGELEMVKKDHLSKIMRLS